MSLLEQKSKAIAVFACVIAVNQQIPYLLSLPLFSHSLSLYFLLLVCSCLFLFVLLLQLLLSSLLLLQRVQQQQSSFTKSSRLIPVSSLYFTLLNVSLLVLLVLFLVYHPICFSHMGTGPAQSLLLFLWADVNVIPSTVL